MVVLQALEVQVVALVRRVDRVLALLSLRLAEDPVRQLAVPLAALEGQSHRLVVAVVQTQAARQYQLKPRTHHRHRTLRFYYPKNPQLCTVNPNQY